MADKAVWFTVDMTFLCFRFWLNFSSRRCTPNLSMCTARHLFHLLNRMVIKKRFGFHLCISQTFCLKNQNYPVQPSQMQLHPLQRLSISIHSHPHLSRQSQQRPPSLFCLIYFLLINLLVQSCGGNGRKAMDSMAHEMQNFTPFESKSLDDQENHELHPNSLHLSKQGDNLSNELIRSGDEYVNLYPTRPMLHPQPSLDENGFLMPQMNHFTFKIGPHAPVGSCSDEMTFSISSTIISTHCHHPASTCQNRPFTIILWTIRCGWWLRVVWIMLESRWM